MLKKMSKRNLVISVLGSALLIQAGYNNEVFGTEITGVSKNNTTGAFDIRPDAFNGSTGFRKYEKFELTKGDVANFIFQYLKNDGKTTGDISKFVNLVDGQANINGIVNALDSVGGALKTDGHLIFVTPQGLVVGSSGVLNVGSLSVLTPTADAYQALKKNILTYGNDSALSADKQIAADNSASGADFDNWLANDYVRGTSSITINGKIAGRGDVRLDGGQVNVGSTGVVFAGVNDQTAFHQIDPATGSVLSPEAAAAELFNQLVSSRMTEGNAFSNTDGKIEITAKTGVNVAKGGMIVNNGSSEGNTFTITNDGNNGIQIFGEVANTNGTLTLDNANGSINLSTTGVINNKGSLNITNRKNNTGLTINGKIKNEGKMNVRNESGTNGLQIGGSIANKGDANITNLSNDFTIAKNGTITNDEGTLTLHNQSSGGAFNIKGNVTSNGENMNITNNGTEMIISGKVNNAAGVGKINNTKGQLLVDKNGEVISDGTQLTMVNTGVSGLNVKGKVTAKNQLVMENNGEGGFNISGTISNAGNTKLVNNSKGTKGFNLESTGRINNEGGSIDITNNAEGGMNIKGIVKTTNDGTIALHGNNSNITIGDNTLNNYYIDSDGDVTIELTDGNLLNFGVAKTLIRTTNQGQDNLIIIVENGAIGEEVSTGLETGARDWTKSINTNIDGTITAKATKGGTNGVEKDSRINLASANKDMRINSITSDGKVTLLADDITGSDSTGYNILNYNKDGGVAVTGSSISMIASGNIGKEGENVKAVTFVQVNGTFSEENFNHWLKGYEADYKPTAEEVINILAKGDIIINGADGDGQTKNDANVGSIISKNGSVDAQFSGNTYIKNITAAKDVNVVNRGKILYIDSLGKTGYESTGDYFGASKVTPTKANIKVLDLGSSYSENSNPESVLVIKNGVIAGTGAMRPGTQDLTATADTVYAGGYKFNTGANRDENGFSTVEKDSKTNMIENPNGDAVTIRAKAVRKDDVSAIDREETERTYYSGGSAQGSDADYEKDGQAVSVRDRGTEDGDDDNLVVAEPTEPTTPTEPTKPTEPTQPTTPTEPTTPN